MRFSNRWQIRWWPKAFGVALLWLAAAASSHANTVTFYTVNGAVTGFGSGNTIPVRDVAAKVVFTTGANTLLIEITNLQVFGPVALPGGGTGNSTINQAIAAVDFLISGVSGIPHVDKIELQTGDASRGNVGSFTSQTAFSASSNLTTVPANAWDIANSASLSGGLQFGTIHATQTNANYLLIGPGPYRVNGTNNGQMRNANDNPYLQTGTAQRIAWLVTFDSGGVDAGDTVTAANMTFGVNWTPGFNPTENLSLEPEPGTVAMMLGGLGLLVFGRRRLRRSQP